MRKSRGRGCEKRRREKYEETEQGNKIRNERKIGGNEDAKGDAVREISRGEEKWVTGWKKKEEGIKKE